MYNIGSVTNTADAVVEWTISVCSQILLMLLWNGQDQFACTALSSLAAPLAALMMDVAFEADAADAVRAKIDMAHLADSVSSLPACLSSSSSIRLRLVDSSWDSLRRAVSCEQTHQLECGLQS